MKEDQHLPEGTETSIDWRKMPRNRPDKDEKHLAYSILIANGVQAAECILDRSDPKAAQASEPVYSFTQINIEEAHFDFKPPPESPGEEPVPITLDAKPRTGEGP